jgi:plasmid stability protein
MGSLTLKDIPPELHRRLKERAHRNGRSLLSEAMTCLQQAVMSERIDVDEFIARATTLREQAAVYITDASLNKTKREGLP